MVSFFLFLVIILQVIIILIITGYQLPKVKKIMINPPHISNEVHIAVRNAYDKFGLEERFYGPNCNLARFGKVYDVLQHAASELGIDHKLVTIEEVESYLSSLRG